MEYPVIASFNSYIELKRANNYIKILSYLIRRMTEPQRPSVGQATDMYYISMFNSAVIEEGKTGKPSADRLIKRFYEAIHGNIKVDDFVKVMTSGVIPSQEEEKKIE